MEKYCKWCHKVSNGETDKHRETCSFTYKYSEDILPLPPEAANVERICRSCGSTDNLLYSKPWSIGSSHYGNEFQCEACRIKHEEKIDREKAMHYFTINDGEIEHYENEDDLESYIDDKVKSWDYESIESYCSDTIVLKAEPLEKINKKAFEGRNIFLYEEEFYLIETVSEIEMEHDGSISISY